jgi:DNA-binding transcriptional LysR family regulator
VADKLSFRGAAERLHVSQPALSQSIRALEEELGVRLFDRSRAGVRLTAAGEVLAQGARHTLRDLEQLVASVRLADGGATGGLVIAFNEVSGQQEIFGRCLSLFRANTPDVEVQLVEMGEAEQRQALRTGDIDAGFHYRLPADATDDPAEFASLTLATHAFLLVVPGGHPLAQRECVPLSMLPEQPMVLLRREANVTTHDAIARIFKQAGLSQREVLEVSTDAAMLAMVEAGFGLGIVMNAERRAGWGNLVLREIEGLSLAKQLVLSWNQHRCRSTLKRFLAIIRESDPLKR